MRASAVRAALAVLAVVLVPACGGGGGGGGAPPEPPFDYATVVLEGQAYGVGMLGVQADPGTYAFTGAGASYGIYDFTTAGDVTTSYVDYTGASGGGAETYAYTAPELVISQGAASGRGPVRRKGNLFMQVQDANTHEPFLLLGSRRFATSGFTNASLNGTWSFAVFGLELLPGPVCGGHAARIGTISVADGTGTSKVTRTETGEPGGTLPGIPFTVDPDGLVHMGTDIRGYLGGAPAKEVALLSSDTDPTQFAFFIATRNGVVPVGYILSGEYRLAMFYVRSEAGVFDHAGCGVGTITFNVNGTYTGTVDVAETNGSVSQPTLSGTHTASAMDNEVVLSDDGMGTVYLLAGPDLDTFFGINPRPGEEFTMLLVLSR